MNLSAASVVVVGVVGVGLVTVMKSKLSSKKLELSMSALA